MSKREKPKYKFIQEQEVRQGYTEVSQSGFYNTPQWQSLRAAYIAQYPLCEHCKPKRLYRAANVVDHIVQLTMDNLHTHGLYWSNLQSLCNRCHRVKTNQSKGRYSPENLDKGKKAMAKFNNFNK